MKVRKLLMVLCMCVFLYSSYNLFQIYLDYKEIDDTYEKIEEEYVKPEKKEDKKEEYLSIDFDSLLKRNSDVVGWISIPDSNVNYPILHGKTNDDYIRRDIDKKSLSAGSIFVEASTTTPFLQDNTIIYGHNMKNGSMFHNIKSYNNDMDYLNKHPYIYIYSPDGKILVYRVFASHIVHYDDSVYTNTVSDFDSYIKHIQKTNTLSVDVDLSTKKPMILLSTCASGGGESGKRNVVHGILEKTIEK